MKNPVYQGLWILYMNNMVIYVYWYNYPNQKYGDSSKICYTGSFIVHVKFDTCWDQIWFVKLQS